MAAAGRRHRRRYRPPSNYARIIKVESHREHWRAVHSNCSLGIYTCGTPPASFEASTLFWPSIALSLFLSLFQLSLSVLSLSTLDTASLALALLLAYLLHRGNNEANYPFWPTPFTFAVEDFPVFGRQLFENRLPRHVRSFSTITYLSHCCKIHISIEF